MYARTWCEVCYFNDFVDKYIIKVARIGRQWRVAHEHTHSHQRPGISRAQREHARWPEFVVRGRMRRGVRAPPRYLARHSVLILRLRHTPFALCTRFARPLRSVARRSPLRSAHANDRRSSQQQQQKERGDRDQVSRDWSLKRALGQCVDDDDSRDEWRMPCRTVGALRDERARARTRFYDFPQADACTCGTPVYDAFSVSMTIRWNNNNNSAAQATTLRPRNTRNVCARNESLNVTEHKIAPVRQTCGRFSHWR